MARYFVVLVIAAAFLATSETATAATHSNEVKVSKLLSQSTGPGNRYLRTATISEEDEEERGVLGLKVLKGLSNFAEKQNMQTFAKKLEHKAWLKTKKLQHKAWLKTKKLQHKAWLEAGETPQTLFRKFKWKGKTSEQLEQDPNFPLYEGFDDVWMKAQYKKGTIHTPDAWVKLFEEQMKKKATS